jgi:hypothetical protein
MCQTEGKDRREHGDPFKAHFRIPFRLHRPEALALWGDGFSNCTKPLLYFAKSWGA